MFRTEEVSSGDEGVSFECEVQGAGFRGAVKSDTGYRNSPYRYFSELASHWLGWEGERSWHSDGNEVVFRATTDRLGHVTIRVTLRTFEGQELSIPIELEAGSLRDLSSRMERLFG